MANPLPPILLLDVDGVINASRPGWGAALAKLAAARQVLTEGRRLIWADDTEVPLSGEVHDELVAAGALLIRPKGSTGLQPEHLDAIEEFAARTDPSKSVA